MKKLILALLIFLVSISSVKAEDPLVADPIINHLRLAMEDDKELEYSLKRCAGLFLASGTALHKLVEENHPDAQQFVDLGEELMEYLAKYQIIVIDISELTQESFNKTYSNNIEEIQRMNRSYYARMSDNFSTSGTIIENDVPLGDDVFTCIGFHEQIFGNQ
jgi:hypothetical protein